MIDLGCDHSARLVIRDGEPQGVEITHVCNGAVREGYIPFVGPGPLWTLEKGDPLTVSPSLQCMRCPDHGFIREGRWVPV